MTISFYKFVAEGANNSQYANTTPIIDGIEFTDKNELARYLNSYNKHFVEILDKVENKTYLIPYNKILRIEIKEK